MGIGRPYWLTAFHETPTTAVPIPGTFSFLWRDRQLQHELRICDSCIVYTMVHMKGTAPRPACLFKLLFFGALFLFWVVWAAILNIEVDEDGGKQTALLIYPLGSYLICGFWCTGSQWNCSMMIPLLELQRAMFGSVSVLGVAMARAAGSGIASWLLGSINYQRSSLHLSWGLPRFMVLFLGTFFQSWIPSKLHSSISHKTSSIGISTRELKLNTS